MDLSGVTFVILTKDEERNIGDCLDSLPHEAKALVYDAESSDRTRAIAAERGASVSVAPWRGVGPARDGAQRLVQTEWIFILDADERVTPALRAEMSELAGHESVDAYTVPRANYFCGRWIRGAAWWPDRQVRLYRKGRATLTARDDRSKAAGHVYFVAERTGELSGHIIHYSYGSLADYRRKFKLYTDNEANARRATAGEFARAWLVMPLRALWLLIWRRGALDGWRGVYVSVASAL